MNVSDLLDALPPKLAESVKRNAPGMRQAAYKDSQVAPFESCVSWEVLVGMALLTPIPEDLHTHIVGLMGNALARIEQLKAEIADLRDQNAAFSEPQHVPTVFCPYPPCEKCGTVKVEAKCGAVYCPNCLTWVTSAEGWSAPANPSCPECGNDSVEGKEINDHGDTKYRCRTPGCTYSKICEGADA